MTTEPGPRFEIFPNQGKTHIYKLGKANLIWVSWGSSYTEICIIFSMETRPKVIDSKMFLRIKIKIVFFIAESSSERGFSSANHWIYQKEHYTLILNKSIP